MHIVIFAWTVVFFADAYTYVYRHACENRFGCYCLCSGDKTSRYHDTTISTSCLIVDFYISAYIDIQIYTQLYLHL